MNDLYSTLDIRKIEEKMLKERPLGALMHQAAQKLANWVMKNITPDSSILVLAGTGNNGGDGIEMATLLPQYRITILQLAPSKTKEALLAFEKAQKLSHIHFTKDFHHVKGQKWDLIVDALLGIGLKRALSADITSLVLWANNETCPRLAVDCPTGLNTDTGVVLNEAIKASTTITFLGNKPGFYTKSGRDFSGHIMVEPLGKPSFTPSFQLNDPSFFHLFKRHHDSHKGTFGRVVVIGGENGMTGAPLLAARAALQSGTGLTYVAYVGTLLPFDPVQPEIMHRDAFSCDYQGKILVIGPGLGLSEKTLNLLKTLLKHSHPIVLDADALNLIAKHQLENLLSDRKAATIITPHPLEAARLLKSDVTTVQENRIKAAQLLSETLNTITILKGSGTIISSEKGDVFINPTGNPALATAGTGDVLAGLCGSLLAQNVLPLQAALAATWLHGKAADECACQNQGPIGLTASEIIPKIRFLLNQLAK